MYSSTLRDFLWAPEPTHISSFSWWCSWFRMHDVTPHTPLLYVFVANLLSSPCQHLTGGAAKLSMSHVSKHVQHMQMGKGRLDWRNIQTHISFYLTNWQMNPLTIPLTFLSCQKYCQTTLTQKKQLAVPNTPSAEKGTSLWRGDFSTCSRNCASQVGQESRSPSTTNYIIWRVEEWTKALIIKLCFALIHPKS